MSVTIIRLGINVASTKAVLIDLSGTGLDTAEQAYCPQTPQPGWVEQDSESVWSAMITVLRTDGATEGRLAKLVDLNELAAERGQNLAQIALDWDLRCPVVTSLLVGTSNAG